MPSTCQFRKAQPIARNSHAPIVIPPASIVSVIGVVVPSPVAIPRAVSVPPVAPRVVVVTVPAPTAAAAHSRVVAFPFARGYSSFRVDEVLLAATTLRGSAAIVDAVPVSPTLAVPVILVVVVVRGAMAPAVLPVAVARASRAVSAMRTARMVAAGVVVPGRAAPVAAGDPQLLATRSRPLFR